MKTFIFFCLTTLSVSCSKIVTGTVTDARSYHHGLSARNDFMYSDYIAKLCDMPTCIVPSKGDPVYLAVPSSDFMSLASEQVKVRGTYFRASHILYPRSVKVWREGRWKPVDIKTSNTPNRK